MADFGSDLEAFRAEARAWLEENSPQSLRRQPDLTMEQMEGGLRPTGDAGPLAPADGRQGLGHADLAEGIRRRRPRPGRGARAAAGDGPHRRRPTRSSGMGPRHVRPDPAGIRHRGAEARAPPADRRAASCAGARATPSRAPAPTSPRCRPRPRTRATTGWSTARRSGPRGAQFADWCFCLVRTDPKAKKHEGISFLLIDMRQPGVEARPIKMISGASAVLRDLLHRRAGADKDDLVGPAERRLDHRQAAAAARALRPGRRRRMMRRPARQPRRHSPRSTSASTRRAASPTPTCARALSPHMMDAKAHALTMPAGLAEARGNPNPSATTSIMKNSGTQIGQDARRADAGDHGPPGPGLGGRRLHADELLGRARLARRQGRPRSSAAPTRSRTTSSPSASWACRTRPSRPEVRRRKAAHQAAGKEERTMADFGGADLEPSATRRGTGWRTTSRPR